MIRFNCPACGASYTAPPGDSGKTVECNACQTEFSVPLVVAPAPRSRNMAPPPTPANETVEVHPCPKCGARLSVLGSDLGSDIECPKCQTVYPAVSADDPPPPPPRKPSIVKPKKSERDEDEDEDRPKKRKSKRRKSSASLRDNRYRTFAPHDGVLMIVLSIVGTALDGIGIFCSAGSFAGLVLSVFVIFKGSMSIGEIKKGLMEPGGRVMLEVARGVAVVNVVLAVAWVVFLLVIKNAQIGPAS